MTAQLILDIGSASTDIIIMLRGAPRLTRTIPTGYDAIIRAAVQNLNIDEEQARQFVAKFGMSSDKLEGQINKAIGGTIDILLGELEKSIKFFRSRYPDQTLERIVMTGAAATLPEFPLYVANKYGITVEIGDSWCNASIPAAQRNELQSIANQLGVAVGLAERKE
jgi:Tfp pilus assembly PilM family ATPase